VSTPHSGRDLRGLVYVKFILTDEAAF
jgi:hypothetical protein